MQTEYIENEYLKYCEIKKMEPNYLYIHPSTFLKLRTKALFSLHLFYKKNKIFYRKSEIIMTIHVLADTVLFTDKRDEYIVDDLKITQCQGHGQGSCKRCEEKGIWNRAWMCFLYHIEGYDGCYCKKCIEEIKKEYYLEQLEKVRSMVLEKNDRMHKELKQIKTKRHLIRWNGLDIEECKMKDGRTQYACFDGEWIKNTLFNTIEEAKEFAENY